MSEIEWHPVAEIFPMLDEEELRELADDIQKNGLREPIKLWHGMGLDGRNRLAACELIGFDPVFEELPDDIEPIAYVLSLNVNRRHMSKGALAMAAVECLHSRQTSVRDKADQIGVSKDYVQYASTVREHASYLSKQVIDGVVTLNDAFTEAKRNRDASKRNLTQMDQLRESARDLADLVTEEQLSVTDAFAAWKAREREESNRKRAHSNFLDEHIGAFIPALQSPDPSEIARDYVDLYIGEYTYEQVMKVSGFLATIAKMMKGRK